MGEEKDAGIFKHSTLNVLTNRNSFHEANLWEQCD